MGSGRKSRWAGDAGVKRAATAVTESERKKLISTSKPLNKINTKKEKNFFPEGSWKSISENRK